MIMNIGYGKYHPGGPIFTYKGKKVPCLVGFCEGGGISGNILANILRHLKYFKLCNNYRKNGIIPALLVDGNVSHFDMGFLKYICDENNKYILNRTERNIQN